MRYISLGQVSSKQEFSELIAKTKNRLLAENQVRGFADLLDLISKTERNGFDKERKRWTPTEDASVFTYLGPPDADRLNAIWAAIQIQPGNRTIVLLKLVDDSAESHAGLLADALDRSSRGNRHD